MPTYQYSCTECGHFLEVVQAFTDDSLTECPECGGRLRKVFGAVGVVFKGSGFYRTDSRGKDSAADSSSSSGSTEKSGGEKKPAADAKPATPAKDSGSSSSSTTPKSA
ncbi:FmdB family zinc ribbon protein [Nocardioides aequoreus]|uniref:FmdB family zinc ribbon protein n=1 Tax=Nocardioides aequoreus TaxID=397278 RepID=UPI0004C45A87|nr:FmdB family zinc ribbon protein [Nocardioides aequoreus]